MTLLMTLVQEETVQLDRDRLGDLYLQLGETGAEQVIGRAGEELALRLSHCEQLWRRDERDRLRKCARSLIAISEQIGMTELARVAGDVTAAADRGDAVALGATLFRLIRVGEKSLSAMWNLQGLSL